MHRSSMKKLACAVALAGAFATGTASAATTDLGTLPYGPTSFSGFAPPTSPLVPFLDIFTFVLPTSISSGYTVVNFPLEIPQGTFNLLFGGMALVDPGADGMPGGGDDTTLASDVTPGGSATLSVSFGPTAAPRSLYLAVEGVADNAPGSLGGLYSGAISVTPVPEPEVWAMMLVGVGLVGFRLRNRSKRIAANRFA